MPHPHTIWRTDRPAGGFYAAACPADPGRVVRTFLPEHYEPRYAYPLLAFFPGSASAEEALRLAPLASRRNFIAVAVPGGGDPAEAAERVVEQTRRTYHTHSERTFLVGVGGGCGDAFRAAFALGDRIAGVAALDGVLPPRVPGEPLFRLDRVRGSRVLFAHADPAVAAEVEQSRRLLASAGACVTARRYRSPQGMPPELPRDLNRWAMEFVTAGAGRLAKV